MAKSFALLGAVCLIFGIALFALSPNTLSPSFAQAELTPTPLSPEACQGENLIALKAEIDMLIADFAQNAGADPTKALDGLYTAGERYQQLALDCGYIPPNVGSLVIGTTDLARILTVLETLNGDPLRGQLLYLSVEMSASGNMLGCAGCHGSGGTIAPPTEGTWTRWDEVRSQDPRFAGYTFEQYVIESVILPWDYFVPTFPEFTMPNFYQDQLGYQDLADLVAFLESQDQLVP